MRKSSFWFRLMTLMAVAVLAFAACSDDEEPEEPAAETEEAEEDAGGGEATTLAISAQDNLYEPDTLSAPAGAEVTVELTNVGDNPHTFTIDGLADTGTVESAGTGTATFTMPDTETTWSCAVHGEAMSGTLTPE